MEYMGNSKIKGINIILNINIEYSMGRILNINIIYICNNIYIDYMNEVI